MPNEPLNARELYLEQIAGNAKQQFTQPPIDPTDEGDLAFMIATDEKAGVVRLRFSKSILWLAFEPEQAREFASLLLEKAKILESQKESPQE